jgi:hypothetical protein
MPSKKTTARPTAPVKPGAAQQSASAPRRTPEVDQTQVRQERAQKFLRAERLRQAELEAQGYCF